MIGERYLELVAFKEREAIMATLEDIQNMVTEAQQELRRGNSKQVQQVIWPKIKYALARYTDISMEERQSLMMLIQTTLEKQNLQGAEPAPIDVRRLRIEAADRPPLPSPGAVNWLPY